MGLILTFLGAAVSVMGALIQDKKIDQMIDDKLEKKIKEKK